MTPLALFLGVALAGGAGSAARFAVDGVARSLVPARWPVGTFAINVIGSLLLGILAGLALSGAVDGQWRTLVGTGFLGGFTTFSTASVEAARMLVERRWAAGLAYGLGTWAVALVATVLGLAAAAALV